MGNSLYNDFFGKYNWSKVMNYAL